MVEALCSPARPLGQAFPLGRSIYPETLVSRTPTAVLMKPPYTLLLIAISAGFSACQTLPEERFVKADIASADAPAWVQGRFAGPEGTVAFVGRGGGYDVLDERAAFDEAMGHARTQLSHFVSTKVVAEACMRDTSFGARFLQRGRQQSLGVRIVDPLRSGPGRGEAVGQSLRACAHEITSAVIGGLAVSDQYWERWEVQTKEFLFSPVSMRRYKCWVLCTVEEADIDQYVSASLAALINKVELEEAEADLAAQAAEATASAIQSCMTQELAQEDLEVARAELAGLVQNNRVLNERIHYGRRFRLLKTEDCLHYPAPCPYPAEHPEWRTTDVIISRETVPVFIDALVEPAVVPEGCGACGSSHFSGGSGGH